MVTSYFYLILFISCTLICSFHPSSLRVRRVIISSRQMKPRNIENTANYRESQAKSTFLTSLHIRNTVSERKKVIVIGGGLSGLSCAKYLVDAGYSPVVLEARDILGGKVSAWRDDDGDWIETGLHIFFGAYPNMMNLFKELNIEDRLQWKKHQMTFAMADKPGKFTKFEFTEGIPAPFNMALAILGNTEMLSLTEKILMVPALVPMLVQGQDFIDAQDELSVIEFMRKYGMPDRVNEEIFIAMSKALDFIDPEKLSMAVILTAMNRFINEADGSQTAFLDGNAPARLCQPLREYIESRGGMVCLNSPVAEILTSPEIDGAVEGLRLVNGTILHGDEYVSAMPVDVFKRLIPESWSTNPFFRQCDELQGIPVINIQIWFDRKLVDVDGLVFSRSPLLSVYADMSTSCQEYLNDKKSMLELVFAPCDASAAAEGSKNWMAATDEEIFAATMKELSKLFPNEISQDYMVSDAGARVEKYSIVRTPRSVYAAIPGRNKYRPSQKTPVPNFTLAGDWTSQKFLGSMEGAILAGKLAAESIATQYQKIKPVAEDIIRTTSLMQSQRKPRGLIKTNHDPVIAYGGGSQRKK